MFPQCLSAGCFLPPKVIVSRSNTTKSLPEAARPLSTKASARPLLPSRWKWCASPKAANYHTAPRAAAPSSISAQSYRRYGRKTTVPFRCRRPTNTITATHAAERQTGAKQRAIRFPAYTGAPFIQRRKKHFGQPCFCTFRRQFVVLLIRIRFSSAGCFYRAAERSKAACTFKICTTRPFLARAGAHAFLHGFGFFTRTHFRHHHFVALCQA